MVDSKSSGDGSDKRKHTREDDSQKWYSREEIQDIAKIGGDILKKTVATGKGVLKDVKDNFPKEATQFIVRGKEEILKGLSQEMARTLLVFTMEKFFTLARQHRIEFSIRIRKNESEDDKKQP